MPKREDNPSPQELRREAKQIEERGEEGGKRASNVAGGKKAAATRKERAGEKRSSEGEED